VTVAIVAIACTTSVEFGLLVIEPEAQFPVPPVELTVTLKLYVFAGVAAVVAITRFGLGAALVSVGLVLVVTPAGVPPTKVTVTTGVQVPFPVHVVVSG
jgi:hypothetical protein